MSVNRVYALLVYSQIHTLLSMCKELKFWKIMSLNK